MRRLSRIAQGERVQLMRGAQQNERAALSRGPIEPMPV
jgi:hypothetical protein